MAALGLALSFRASVSRSHEGWGSLSSRTARRWSRIMETGQITGGWGSKTTSPLERFIARAKRALADPTIQKATVPVDELRAALESLSRK